MKIKRRNFFLEIIIGIVVVYTSVLDYIIYISAKFNVSPSREQLFW